MASIQLVGLAPQANRTFNGQPSQPLNILGAIGDAMVDAKGKVTHRLRTPVAEDKYFFLDAVDKAGNVLEGADAETVLIWKSKAVAADFGSGKLSIEQVTKLQVNQWEGTDGSVRYTAMYHGTQRGHLDTTKLLAAAKKAANPTRVATASAEVLAYVL